MSVRLGFSIATSVDADILIVDEVLAVGDLAFQRKCFDRMEEIIKRQGKTVLLVSHNIRQIERLCNRVIMLDHAHILHDGDPKTVCQLFYEKSDEKIRASVGTHARSYRASGEVELIDLYFLDHNGNRTNRIAYNRDLTACFVIRAIDKLDNVTFGFGIHTTDFLYLTTHNSEEQIHIDHLTQGEHYVSCKVMQIPLLPGVYSLRFGVTAGQAARTLFYAENLLHFQVIQEDRNEVPITSRQGFFTLKTYWELDNSDKRRTAPSILNPSK